MRRYVEVLIRHSPIYISLWYFNRIMMKKNETAQLRHLWLQQRRTGKGPTLDTLPEWWYHLTTNYTIYYILYHWKVKASIKTEKKCLPITLSKFYGYVLTVLQIAKRNPTQAGRILKWGSKEHRKNRYTFKEFACTK